MSDSLLFFSRDDLQPAPAMFVEGVHQPDMLAGASGVYISSAGSAMLESGLQTLKSQRHWLWICIEKGSCAVTAEGQSFLMKANDCTFIPPDTENIQMEIGQECRVLWLTVGGTLSEEFMRRLGAVEHHIMRQGALPSQKELAKHILQSVVRAQDVKNGSSAQLQQLLWGLLASHNGQPVAMDAVLSHEIAKVIDTMRKNQYKDNYSLSEMAALSRMPMETFRKRFAAEVGMPPQSYQLFCKMERAKELLRQGCTVRQAGIEVGMTDPYHFSKTFKHIVGMNPSAYSKSAGQ